jgi:hypothetical protein
MTERAMKMVIVTPRSNFIQSQDATAFHSVMFHGVCSRDGRRFPNDDPPNWDDTSVTPLELAWNIWTKPEFLVPGYYPVVDEEVSSWFAGYGGVRLGEVTISDCIDVPWSFDSSPELSGDPKSYFDDIENRCDCPPDVPRLFELVVREVALAKEADTVTVTTELGTPPLGKNQSLDVPISWLGEKTAFSSGRNYWFDEAAYDQIKSKINDKLFIVRMVEVRG